MAKNTGENYRIGAVKNRSQVYNPKTDWDGRFTDAKIPSFLPEIEMGGM
ncbi:hypothetical protein [Anoxybacillus flavithermus]|nr:hypothetical protein [Anoxybacillus flavithermus]MBE2941524.1 hypothetical protein [Anoxybacillus flavithermus]MBE2944212.1 hypothetical protein [Anoxybacillus flavithermus]MBE2952512.1 hypothetical protein [Anoxybacillus flavithermus]MBE2955103.1 hypothetical protein [Anoxybacillus flavithermus]MBE2960447.1 hypothetical protein [Anoxybacillus flavithermus]